MKKTHRQRIMNNGTKGNKLLNPCKFIRRGAVMALLATIFIIAACLCLIGLDAAKKIHLMGKLPLAVYLPLAANVPLCGYGLWLALQNLGAGSVGCIFACIFSGLFTLYLWIQLLFFPICFPQKVKTRIRFLMNGRFLVYSALYLYAAFIPIFAFLYPFLVKSRVPAGLLIGNAVYAVCILLFLFFLGLLFIFVTSRRLGLVKRVVMLLTLWIPIVNIFVFVYACRLAADEYDFALYKENLNLTRIEGDLCKTKYPLVMVHGIGFRDFRYFNYWGRITKELIRNGAAVYFGNQEALGTIEYNAGDIRTKIQEVMQQEGCEKVNIIAHSKGGLDARYAISILGLDEFVASLTTMNTPHHGCKFVDKLAAWVPEPAYRFIARHFDNTFRRFGDRNPDFYTATHQFCTDVSREFNKRVHDSEKVYYQSYMSKMKNAWSDTLLSIPYLFIKSVDGENDGLVSVDSAKWGNFRGVITSPGRRGISHGDIIDLKRQDYNGFDVSETYVQIVKELKEKGF